VVCNMLRDYIAHEWVRQQDAQGVKVQLPKLNDVQRGGESWGWGAGMLAREVKVQPPTPNIVFGVGGWIDAHVMMHTKAT